jgi:predicted aconitase with swiveling domain
MAAREILPSRIVVEGADLVVVLGSVVLAFHVVELQSETTMYLRRGRRAAVFLLLRQC